MTANRKKRTGSPEKAARRAPAARRPAKPTTAPKRTPRRTTGVPTAEYSGRDGKKLVAEVRQANGDDSAHVVPEEQLPRLAPEPPPELTGKAERAIYTAMVSSQYGTGIFRESDRWVVTHVAARVAMADKLKKEISRSPLLKTNEMGERVVKGAVKEWRALLKDIENGLRELGMTPAAREKFMLERSATMAIAKQVGFSFSAGRTA